MQNHCDCDIFCPQICSLCTVKHKVTQANSWFQQEIKKGQQRGHLEPTLAVPIMVRMSPTFLAQPCPAHRVSLLPVVLFTLIHLQGPTHAQRTLDTLEMR